MESWKGFEADRVTPARCEIRPGIKRAHVRSTRRLWHGANQFVSLVESLVKSNLFHGSLRALKHCFISTQYLENVCTKCLVAIYRLLLQI